MALIILQARHRAARRHMRTRSEAIRWIDRSQADVPRAPGLQGLESKHRFPDEVGLGRRKHASRTKVIRRDLHIDVAPMQMVVREGSLDHDDRRIARRTLRHGPDQFMEKIALRAHTRVCFKISTVSQSRHCALPHPAGSTAVGFGEHFQRLRRGAD